MSRRLAQVRIRQGAQSDTRVPRSPADYLDYLWERQTAEEEKK
jgi:hypothetical protein